MSIPFMHSIANKFISESTDIIRARHRLSIDTYNAPGKVRFRVVSDSGNGSNLVLEMTRSELEEETTKILRDMNLSNNSTNRFFSILNMLLDKGVNLKGI